MRVLVSWSGGKDCAMALHEILRGGAHEVAGLLTTFSEEHGGVSMHGVRRELAEAQAASIGLPLVPVLVPGIPDAPPRPASPGAPAPEGLYERRMRAALEAARAEGVRGVVAGDLFLQEVRDYRAARLAEVGLEGLFPLWGRDTRALVRDFLAAGFCALTVCVDAKILGETFAGRELDDAFLAELPEGVDPCGENGEFHTFVHQGPLFRGPIPLRKGEVVYREPGFWYRDLLPA